MEDTVMYQRKYDIVIAGAGPAGIAAALEAARANQRAIVAEQENLRLHAILEYVAMMS